jgi:16S rRNA (guanine(966)-N(2))-methyltransferase RsmD
MRIITGSARGVSLLTLPGEATRPTAERTKEAVFSMIQFDIEGRKVLDLFAGSGQLALEALSRGAASAILCDKSKEAVNVIKKNAEKTRLSEKCKIYSSDAQTLLGRLGDERFDIVFLDPPYALKAIPGILFSLIANKRLKPTSIIVCETAEAPDVFGSDDELCEKFNIKKQTRYGAACVTIMSPKEESL